MTKILRNAPWLFLYAVSFHTNSAAMDKNSKAMEPYKLEILRQNQSFVKTKCYEDYQRKKLLQAGNSNDRQQFQAASRDYCFFKNLSEKFEEEVTHGCSVNMTAKHTLNFLNREYDLNEFSHTVKEDICLCLGDVYKRTQS